MKNILVVPTIREEKIHTFLELWKNSEDWHAIVVIEDNPEKSFDLGIEHHYSQKEILEDLGDDAWIVSKRDSAIRSYGFLVAYRLGADYIFTLDDDCEPLGENYFCDRHIQNMEKMPRWTESILGVRTRGIPYENKGALNNVVLNMGLWEGIPDFDSIQSVSGNVPNDFKSPDVDRIIPKGQYFPLCGMNLAFKREATPLCLFSLMGDDQPYRRFDDIWCGIIMKKICDYLNLNISCGRPMIFHNRYSNAFENLVKEAPGIKFSESFWEIIDKIKLTSNNPKDCMYEIGENLYLNNDLYLQKYGKAIKIWSDLF